MAAAPVTTEDPKKTDTTASSTAAPVDQSVTAAPANPTPVSAPPVTSSNANDMATESSQTTAAPPVQTDSLANQAAAAASAGKAANSASTAASKAGESQSKAQAAVTSTASTTASKASGDTKKAAVVKTALEIQADALAAAPDTIKKMMEGDDPIATREFNMMINAVGPKNQLALEGMALKLKQQNLDGQGAGSALIEMMARDQGYEVDNLIGKISADSAKRLYDLNIWGFDKATEIQATINKNKRNDFDLALKNGQFDAAADIWEDIFPGVSFDVSAAKARDPVTQDMFTARTKLVDQLVSQGDAEGAKQAMLDLAKSNPEAFGFKTPEEAVASLQGVDFSKEAWANTSKFNNEVNEAIRVAALQGDRGSSMLAIDRYYANKLPGSADREGAAALSSMSLDEINAVLKANDKAPVTEQTKMTIGAEEFAKDKKYADEKSKANGANSTDLLLNQLIEFHPEIGIDPKLRDASRAWIFDNLAGAAVSADGNSVSGFSFKEGSGLPPWDNNSVSSHLYTTWPQATFNEDGSLKATNSEGGAPYTDTNPRGDVTTPIGAQNAVIDKNYEAYVMKTRVDPTTRLNRQDWYYATKGGTQVDPLEQFKTAEPLDTAKAVEDIKAKDRTNTPLTAAEEKIMLEAGAYPEYAVANLPVGAEQKAMVGQKVNLGGKVYKVTVQDYSRTGWSGGYAGDPRHTDWAELTANDGSKIYIYNGAQHTTPPKKV